MRILRVPLPNLTDFDWHGWATRLALPTIVLLVLAYCADQILSGERGLLTWRVMREQVSTLKSEINQLNKDVTRMNTRVLRLRAPLDEDYLDQQIRYILPMVKPGEVVIVH